MWFQHHPSSLQFLSFHFKTSPLGPNNAVPLHPHPVGHLFHPASCYIDHRPKHSSRLWAQGSKSQDRSGHSCCRRWNLGPHQLLLVVRQRLPRCPRQDRLPDKSEDGRRMRNTGHHWRVQGILQVRWSRARYQHSRRGRFEISNFIAIGRLFFA